MIARERTIDAYAGRPKSEVHVVQGAVYTDWETIYVENVVNVYRMIFARVGNRPDAEDLTEDVFLKSLPQLDLPASVGQVRAYLAAAARTVLADHWRRHYGAPVADVEIETLSRPPDLIPSAEGAGRAARILALLPERSRQILELRFIRGYSIKEAAGEMGVTAGNAKILQFRALRLAAEIGQRMLT
jgi:RNA polymerase sigma factor (sigma-70 family)